MPFTFEMPPRMEDAPKPSAKTARRLDLPDGEHWVMAKGGGTQVEGEYLNFYQMTFAQAVAQYRDGKLDEAPMRALERDLNAAYATWLADRVVDHNFTDDDGEKLPLGLDLFWALPNGGEGVRLANWIQRRPSFFADPKAESASPGG